VKRETLASAVFYEAIMITAEATSNKEPRSTSAVWRSTTHIKVAYIMSRFPKLTETFILYEMLALEQQGIQVELYPLLRERTTVMHPEAVPLVARAHFQPFLSWPILRAQLRFLRRKPRAYLSTLWTLLRSNLGSLNFFIGAIGIFPKTVYFAELLSAEHVQHIHAHFANHPAAAAFIIHRLTSIPYSFTAHGSDLHVDRHMLCEKVSEAAFVVSISSYNKELITEECGNQVRDKIVVIHCGVDTQVFQPIVRDTSSGSLTILCTGTLHEVKGQTYLIEACKLLNERGIAFTCNFVGDGPDQQMLSEQIAKAGLHNRVFLLGRRTREQVAELLRGADVVVAPSVPTSQGKREGIPVVLMEAMGSGVPVIASAISGIPELVEHECSGLLTPPRDAAAIAAALEQLFRNPELRHKLGQAGREKVVQEFDLARNAALLADHFRETTEHGV
jgi:glycosyltransferase involved in cell wall biosynthesis